MVCICFIILALFGYANVATATQNSTNDIDKKVNNIVDRIVIVFEKLEDSKHRNSIAVLDFDDKTIDRVEHNIGFAVSELLTTKLSESGKFRIVERKRINKILEEIALGQTGLIDEDEAVRAGRLSGADIIVLGSVSELGNLYNLNIRLIEVESANIMISMVENLEKEWIHSSEFYFKPKKYRFGVGIGYHINRHNFIGEDTLKRMWWTIEYSFDLNPDIFIDFELGFDSSRHEEAVGLFLHPNHTLEIKDNSGIISSKINYWLMDKGTLGFSTFTGFRLLINRYRYQASWNDLYGGLGRLGERGGKHLFPIILVGASFCMYQVSMVSARFDLGYQFSLKTIVHEYPYSISQKPSNFVVDPSGIITSAKIRMYF